MSDNVEDRTSKVRASAKGILWSLYDVNERESRAICQKFDLSEFLSRLLSIRNIGLDEVNNFLNPSIKTSLSDPFLLKDMDKAASRIVRAIENNENIVIYGDYDVDGATSSSFLKCYFRLLGKETQIYIPDRISEGYGPNANALTALKNKGADLCITVDCGTMSFEPLQTAKDIGLEVIVIDHHLSAENLPEAIAVVNPNRIDEDSDQGHLAAVGVSFMLAVAVNKILLQNGFFEEKTKPDLLKLLDIVALGTVCDMVPLKGINRAFVHQGLKVIKSRSNKGIAALADVAKVNSTPSCYHLGFAMGPRINAGGRVGKSFLGAKLLSCQDADEANAIANELDEFNLERRNIEAYVLEQAIEQVEKDNRQDNPVIFCYAKDWHPGVVGIVASRITERYGKPSAIISINAESIGKASARSIKGIDFGSAIVSANQLGIVLAGGGHAMAAGFTLLESKIDEMYNFLCEKFSSHYEKQEARTQNFDSYLSLNALNLDLYQQIEQLGPFGMANHEPRFVFSKVKIIRVDVVGANHIRCIISSDTKANGGKTIKAMAFRAAETELGDFLLNNYFNEISLVAKVKHNEWNGQSNIELIIEDAIFSE